MRVGIEILDQAIFRKIIDDGLEHLGYKIANSDVDKQLYRAHYCHLTPCGLGRSFLLKFSQQHRDRWDRVTLIDARTNEYLSHCDLPTPNLDSNPQLKSQPSSRPYPTLWAEQIVAMVAASMHSPDER